MLEPFTGLKIFFFVVVVVVVVGFVPFARLTPKSSVNLEFGSEYVKHGNFAWVFGELWSKLYI